MFVMKSALKLRGFPRYLNHFVPFPAGVSTKLSTAILLPQNNLTVPQLGVRFFANYDASRKRPMLMDFPRLVWPSVVKTVRNWIMVSLIIRPYFDHDFRIPDFVQGAKHALHVVSSALAGGETKQLEGLVDRTALNDVKQSLSKMSVAERYDLQVDKEDVYFSFPYQVGIMFDESEDDSQKRFVEITMVFHVLRGLKGMIERGEPVPLNVGTLPEFRDKISICNYRFIKEFTKGVESDWTVNVVNHFKPSDYLDQ